MAFLGWAMNLGFAAGSIEEAAATGVDMKKFGYLNIIGVGMLRSIGPFLALVAGAALWM